MKTATGCALTEHALQGFFALRLENDLLMIDVLPELGGRIWSVLYRPTSRQWIWHNPRVGLHNVGPGASYDDHWAGGWEELFPNDAAGRFMRRDLPDHGEWWSRPWRWEIAERSSKRVEVRLQLEGVATRTHCEKSIVVQAESPAVTVHYRITSHEPEPLHCLFKQHLAVAMTPEDRVELPGGTVTPVDLAFSTLIGGDGPFEWPVAFDRAGTPVDLRMPPPVEAQHREFVYVADLPEGWCGVRDTKTGSGLRLEFPREVFPYTWLFMTFGGWRGLYTVVLEPCTNMPKDLNTAYREGRCATLAPGGTLECAVEVQLS